MAGADEQRGKERQREKIHLESKGIVLSLLVTVRRNVFDESAFFLNFVGIEKK